MNTPGRGTWEIKFTPEAERWLKGLGAPGRAAFRAALDALERSGPSLRRPHAGSIKGSRHHNMKELRSVGGNLRALFALDPNRRAIVLLGGDKTNEWKNWYRRMIPVADKLYANHLRSLGKEGPSTRDSRAGGRSADSSQ